MINQNLLAALTQQHQQQQQQSRILAQVKAGCSTREGKMVKPDKRKGRIVVCVEDQLLHFQWRERDSTVPQQDFIVFPGEAKFFRVDKIKDGRVYCLEFQSNDKQLFYWLQEPKTDRDDEICKKINDCLSNTPMDQYTQQQSNLLNLFQNAAPPRQSQQPRNAVQLDQLQQILQTMTPSTSQQQQQQQEGAQQQGAAQQTAPAQQQQQQQQQQGPDLRDVLDTGALVATLCRHPDIAQQLTQYLPEGTPSNISAVIDHVRSAPFQQSVTLFAHALQTGELSGLMVSMGLPAHTGSLFGG